MKKNVYVFLFVALVVSVFMASEVLAECPEGKNPVSITTPSGKTKTLCIPDAAVQGIENAAEHSGGTIVASNCACFSEDDILALDAMGDFYCTGKTGIGSDGTETFSSTTCKGVGGSAATTYDSDGVNSCSLYLLGDKYNPPVKISEIISDSEYNACLSNISPVAYPPK